MISYTQAELLNTFGHIEALNPNQKLQIMSKHFWLQCENNGESSFIIITPPLEFLFSQTGSNGKLKIIECATRREKTFIRKWSITIKIALPNDVKWR